MNGEGRKAFSELQIKTSKKINFTSTHLGNKGAD